MKATRDERDAVLSYFENQMGDDPVIHLEKSPSSASEPTFTTSGMFIAETAAGGPSRVR